MREAAFSLVMVVAVEADMMDTTQWICIDSSREEFRVLGVRAISEIRDALPAHSNSVDRRVAG
jgi:hypothetical protein